MGRKSLSSQEMQQTDVGKNQQLAHENGKGTLRAGSQLTGTYLCFATLCALLFSLHYILIFYIIHINIGSSYSVLIAQRLRNI